MKIIKTKKLVKCTLVTYIEVDPEDFQEITDTLEYNRQYGSCEITDIQVLESDKK